MQKISTIDPPDVTGGASRRSPRAMVICCLTVFILALLLRAIVWWQLHNDAAFTTLVGDAVAYDAWARQILSGDWLGRSIGVFYQAPLYPYLLSLLYALPFDDLTTVHVVQVVIGSLACVFLALAAKNFFGRTSAAWMAGLMLACCPAAVFFDLQIEKSSIDGALISLLLLSIASLGRRPSASRAVFTGALIGLMALSRENALALLAVAMPVAWIAGRHVSSPLKRHRYGMVAALAVFVGTALVLAPVATRNKIVGDEWKLTTAQFGPNFYIGNNENADGLYRPLREGRGDARFERADATDIAETAEHRKLSSGEVSRYWSHQAWGEIARDPLRWVRLLGQKLLLTINRVEIADNNDIDTLAVVSPVLGGLLTTFHFGVLFALAVAGVPLLWSRRAAVWPIVGFVVVLLTATALFYVFARYRFPMVAPLILLAAGGLAELPEAFRTRRFVAMTFAMLLGLTAFIVSTSTSLLPERVRGVDFYNRGLALQRRGQPLAAIAAYERALNINPKLADAANNLGLLLSDRNDLLAAAEQFRAVLRIRPRDALAHNNLGMVLGRMGKVDEAIAEFQQAIAIDPQLQQARQNLDVATRMKR